MTRSVLGLWTSLFQEGYTLLDGEQRREAVRIRRGQAADAFAGVTGAAGEPAAI
ncbi:hypothetical protein FF36_01900 [Frankia torreyi]|uniref:Uncharacterized protein n=1 Tax=Frankia torreyi TaxID=1856 RepID=A0A0D8BI42_9ACTN|nr:MULTISPECIES: hypothetical protein [Frankia]KJE23715.1 hypothetical protein FF36_01900 [Frankia torreyi]KQM05673.1 hypothetical protein FF86_101491 [Frankia sp. CpI1-P]